jgi:type I restriction enzyme S subunit
LRGKSPFSTHFLYLGLSEVDISPYITGAAQPKITQENMNRIPFFCGPETLHLKFGRLVGPMISQSQVLQRQIQNLRRTRDLLLPRLMSGQMELPGTEAAA